MDGFFLTKWDPPGVAAPSWLGQNLNLAPLVGNFPCRSKLSLAPFGKKLAPLLKTHVENYVISASSAL